MYLRAEVSQAKQAFWTAFSQYMLPVPSAEGEKVNWVNYKAGEKGVQFKMDANMLEATIAIVLTQHDGQQLAQQYALLTQLKTVLETHTAEAWIWQPPMPDAWGRLNAMVLKTLPHAGIMHRDHWPQLISFFKPRIMALDAFWSEAKHAFEALR